VREAVTASSRWRLFSFSEPWSEAMSELDKAHPEVSLLSAFASTIAVALAVGLPLAVAIIWVCS